MLLCFHLHFLGRQMLILRPWLLARLALRALGGLLLRARLAQLAGLLGLRQLLWRRVWGGLALRRSL